ncbi:hypothetical protein HK097_005913, partial [Rhizophlyctis rosea]
MKVQLITNQFELIRLQSVIVPNVLPHIDEDFDHAGLMQVSDHPHVNFMERSELMQYRTLDIATARIPQQIEQTLMRVQNCRLVKKLSIGNTDYFYGMLNKKGNGLQGFKGDARRYAVAGL